MTLQEVMAKMVNFETLVEPQEMVIIASHISGLITDFQAKYDEDNLRYSLRWEEVKYTPAQRGEKPLSDKMTDIVMMRDQAYQDLVATKRVLAELKRYRSDLNRKLDVIMGIKRRS